MRLISCVSTFISFRCCAESLWGECQAFVCDSWSRKKHTGLWLTGSIQHGTFVSTKKLAPPFSVRSFKMPFVLSNTLTVRLYRSASPLVGCVSSPDVVHLFSARWHHVSPPWAGHTSWRHILWIRIYIRNDKNNTFFRCRLSRSFTMPDCQAWRHPSTTSPINFYYYSYQTNAFLFFVGKKINWCVCVCVCLRRHGSGRCLECWGSLLCLERSLFLWQVEECSSL